MLSRKLRRRQSLREIPGRSVIVLLPGVPTEYMKAPSFAIPINKDGLPTNMTTMSGQEITVNWDDGNVWEIRQHVKLGVVDKKGGTLLLLSPK